MEAVELRSQKWYKRAKAKWESKFEKHNACHSHQREYYLQSSASSRLAAQLAHRQQHESHNVRSTKRKWFRFPSRRGTSHQDIEMQQPYYPYRYRYNDKDYDANNNKTSNIDDHDLYKRQSCISWACPAPTMCISCCAGLCACGSAGAVAVVIAGVVLLAVVVVALVKLAPTILPLILKLV